MILQDFEFAKPKTLKETLNLLARANSKVRPIAGGTDFLPGLHQNSRRFSDVEKLIDIHELPELNKIKQIKSGISIGAAVTFTDIEKNPLITENYPLLAKAVSTIGSRQIRNRATIAGNFVNNAPCADSVPPLLIYNAQIRIQSAEKEQLMRLEDFLLKPYRTQIKPEELVTEILLPPLPNGYMGDFYKLGRRRGVAISRITLAVLIKKNKQKIEDICIAAGAVTPIGKRFYELENTTKGMIITDETLKELARQLGKQILMETGLRWSTAYKLPVTQQMFYQLLRKIIRN